MRTLVIHTSKGGVGKTTLTVNLSYEIAKLGNRVLVIDLDAQANSSLYLGVNRADDLDEATTLEDFDKILRELEKRNEIIDFLNADFYSNSFNCKDFIKTSSFDHHLLRSGSSGRIDVIPSSHRTKKDENLSRRAGGTSIAENCLKRALSKPEIADEYDYVIIDTPPTLNIVAKNGLFAARHLLIPTQLEYFSVYGVNSVITDIKQGVQVETDGQRSRVLGIVPMMTEPPRGRKSSKLNKVNNYTKQLLERSLLNTDILPEITRTTNFAKAAEKRLPIRVFAENNPAASAAVMQITSLTQEIITRIDKDESQRGI